MYFKFEIFTIAKRLPSDSVYSIRQNHGFQRTAIVKSAILDSDQPSAESYFFQLYTPEESLAADTRKSVGKTHAFKRLAFKKGFFFNII